MAFFKTVVLALIWLLLGVLTAKAAVDPQVNLSVLVETDRSIYQEGQTIRVEVFSLVGDVPVLALLDRATITYTATKPSIPFR